MTDSYALSIHSAQGGRMNRLIIKLADADRYVSIQAKTFDNSNIHRGYRREAYNEAIRFTFSNR